MKTNKEQIGEAAERFIQILNLYIGDRVTESTRRSMRECIRDYIREVNSIEAIEDGVDILKIDCFFETEPIKHIGDTQKMVLRVNDYTADIMKKIEKKVES